VSLVRASPKRDQVELHPWCQQRDIVEYCQQHDIIVQAYSPLVRAKRMADPTLVEVAKKVGATPAQVLVRCACRCRETIRTNEAVGSIQRGFVPLPKSDNEDRISASCPQVVLSDVLLRGELQRLAFRAGPRRHGQAGRARRRPKGFVSSAILVHTC
jgi:hypothetical protein